MRVKRVDKFKSCRKRRNRNILIFAVIFPCTSIIVGYFVTSTIILPAMGK